MGGAVLGVALGLLRGEAQEAERLESHDTLKMQRQLGWNFGATDVALAYPLLVRVPVSHEALGTLPATLTPRQEALKPYAQATLFQAVSNDEQEAPPHSAQSLREALKPLATPAMDEAFRQGQGLAQLFAAQEEAALATAVVVDLPGPESVAFAAALAPRFEPVFTFDGWPHPLGVVPAHLTLAAVAHHLPLLTRLAAERRVPAPPVFVLDRQRLAPYTDAATQLDNRYRVRLPSAAQLRKLALQHVLYVHPGAQDSPQELDDLNADVVAWREAGLDVKPLAASDLQRDPAADTAAAYVFGGSREVHASFWTLYPWGEPLGEHGAARGLAAAGILSAGDLARVPAHLLERSAYAPVRRMTPFTSPAPDVDGSPPPHRLPAGFGEVRMRFSSRSQALLGPAFTPRAGE